MQFVLKTTCEWKVGESNGGAFGGRRGPARVVKARSGPARRTLLPARVDAAHKAGPHHDPQGTNHQRVYLPSVWVEM